MRDLFVDKDNHMLDSDPYRKTGSPRVEFLKDVRRQFWIDVLVGSVIIAKRAIKRWRKFWKAHRPRRLRITLDITFTRVILIGFLLLDFWPHSAPTIAAPESPALITHIALKKPLEAPDLQPQEPLQPVYVAPVNTAPSGCGDNSYANFIYMHESGCRTNAVNPIGACGIGQALPCSKMGCSLSDYACQNAFFTAYAGKYGGWAGAYAFWIAHSWW